MADFDILVIGAGPGGYVAAIKAAQHGKKVAIVEREQLGGICLNWGCIPTKALLKSAEMLEGMRHAKDYGLGADNVRADFAAVIKRSRDVANGMSKGVEYLMKKNKISVLSGTATLVNAGTVSVAKGDGAAQQVSADSIIIATGHKPRTFPNLPVDGKQVVNYRHLLASTEQPASLLAIGAGAIGMEFGYFFSTLGTKVTVVEVLDQVLPLEDAEIAKVVERQFIKAGVAIRTATKVAKLELKAKSVAVHLEKDGKSEIIEVEKVLVAVGFLANTEGIGLEQAGVKLDERGFIQVDEHCRTGVPNVWAVGDVVRGPMLAHKGKEEGVMVADLIAGLFGEVNYKVIPSVIYTAPEIAWVGQTEEQVKASGRPYKVGTFPFAASGRARAMEAAQGFAKIVSAKDDDEVLGIHVIGPMAGELISEAVLAMEYSASTEDIQRTIHAHPTLSEAIHEAALAVDKKAIDGINR